MTSIKENRIMRTFEFSDGASNKFWNITLNGNSFTVTFGKLGTKGQTQVKDFADDASAKKEHDKLVAEKLKKGYSETTVAATPAPTVAPAPTPAPSAVEQPTAKPAKSKTKSTEPAAAPVVVTPPTAVPAPVAAATPIAAATTAKRTFEFSDASSHKFWNIEITSPTAFTVTYGRQGTAGTSNDKSFADETKMKKEYDKLVKEKTGKGYTETTPSAKVTPTNLRESLELAIIENPDDLASYMALADYLTEQNDPYGEFLRIELALEDPSKSPKERQGLEQQRADLLKAHEQQWFGEFLPHFKESRTAANEYEDIISEHSFRRGMLHSLTLENVSVKMMRMLAKSPLMRSVQKLTIDSLGFDEEYEPGDDIPEDTEENPQLYPLMRSTNLINIREFQFGVASSQEDQDNAHHGHMRSEAYGVGILGVIKKMPKLVKLRLYARNCDTPQLFALKTLNHLEELLVFHDREYPVSALAKNPSLSKLKSIAFHPHALEDDEAYIRVGGIKDLVRSPHLKSLTHVMIRMNDAGDKGIKEIIDSGILKRLKVLDLRHGCITEKGAKMLAECPDTKNLQHLDLMHNNISAEGIKALQALGISLNTNDQWENDEHSEWLYAGDIE
jgi:uncharacterized protein (TIGR02996 family)